MSEPAPRPTADIVLSVYDGEAHLEEQVRSLQEQTHTEWRLWARDDGSSDGSFALLERLAREDPRIRVHPKDGRNLGAAPCYGFLLEQLPADARYVLCCDADDVWLPTKVADTLDVLVEAEARTGGPVLVHTDMRVVDDAMRTLAPSFWELGGMATDVTTFSRLLVSNVATGPTLAMNRALADLAVPIPAVSPHHDWWIALVASAFGTIEALPEVTVLYRRHGSNVTGMAQAPALVRGLRDLRREGPRAARVKHWIDVMAAQAEVFRERYGDRLDPQDAAALDRVAGIAGSGLLGRKLRILGSFAAGRRGWLRTLGTALRG